ncbi:hypothetical protein FQN57_000620 [Myotisia sp. PD_48]|nr:hypothetical protein FQN57_000620 [Myotisia sp. PD_48]
MTSLCYKKRGYSPIYSLLSVFALASVAWADCVPLPPAIHIGNVTFAPGRSARGLEVSLGSHGQHIAFVPHAFLNNTFVYGSDGFCQRMSEVACESFRGGLYNSTRSNSAGTPSPDSHPTDGEPYPPMQWTSDDAMINDQVTLEKFPIARATEDWGQQETHPQAALGLGPNSTLLAALKSSGRIASLSWGLSWGHRALVADPPLDGTLVLGGYDRARVTGQNYTQKLSTSDSRCSLSVTIDDITLQFNNGTEESLLGSPIPACIQPENPLLLTLPQDPYFLNFQRLSGGGRWTRSNGVYYNAMIYRGAMYDQDLSIKLSSGLVIRIPNDELIYPNLVIDNSTGNFIAREPEPTLMINPLEGESARLPAILGQIFLSRSYILVNHETNELTMWEAEITDNSDPIPLDEDNQAIGDICSPSPIPSSNASFPGNAGNSPDSDPQKGRLSGGQIAGIGVGVALGAMVLLSAIILYRRKRNKSKTQAVELTSDQRAEKGDDDLGIEKDGGQRLETDGNERLEKDGEPLTPWLPIRELDSKQIGGRRVVELDGRSTRAEMPPNDSHRPAA